MELQDTCACCDIEYTVEVLEGHYPTLDTHEQCPECDHSEFNDMLCEHCGKDLGGFYETIANWGEKGEAPIWVTNWRDAYDHYTGSSYNDWLSHIECPRCGHENSWEDSSG